MKDDADLLSNLPSHGARAVRSGNFGEAIVEAAFKSFGIAIVDDNPTYHDEAQLWDRHYKVLIRQYVPPIGGARIDYLFKDFNNAITLAIESKNQMGSGTTDQKLLYTAGRLYKLGVSAFWIVIGGKGWNPLVIKTVTAQIDSENKRSNIIGKIIHDYQFQRSVERLIDLGKI